MATFNIDGYVQLNHDRVKALCDSHYKWVQRVQDERKQAYVTAARKIEAQRKESWLGRLWKTEKPPHTDEQIIADRNRGIGHDCYGNGWDREPDWNSVWFQDDLHLISCYRAAAEHAAKDFLTVLVSVRDLRRLS